MVDAVRAIGTSARIAADEDVSLAEPSECVRIAAVPRLSYVFVWPPTGHRRLRWVRPADRDAFVKTARRVCELYTSALLPLEIENRRSEIRFQTDMGRRSQSTVEATVHLHRLGGWEGALIRLPRGIAGLSPQSRGLLVLDVVHGSVMRLAEARGWDTEGIETVRQHCLRIRLDYHWEGPWKASPNRKLEARGDFRLLDDGFGLARIVVRARTTHVLLGVSATQPAFSTSAGFKRSAKTLRWAGSTSVSMVPWSGLLGERGTVRADVAHLVDWTPWPDYEPVDPSSKRPEVQFLEN